MPCTGLGIRVVTVSRMHPQSHFPVQDFLCTPHRIIPPILHVVPSAALGKQSYLSNTCQELVLKEGMTCVGFMGFCLFHISLDVQTPKLSESQIVLSWEKSRETGKEQNARAGCQWYWGSPALTCWEVCAVTESAWLGFAARLPPASLPSWGLGSGCHPFLIFRFTFVRTETIMVTFRYACEVTVT